MNNCAVAAVVGGMKSYNGIKILLLIILLLLYPDVRKSLPNSLKRHFIIGILTLNFRG